MTRLSSYPQYDIPTAQMVLDHLKKHHPNAIQRLTNEYFDPRKLNNEVTYLADSLELLSDVYPYVKSWVRLDEDTQLLLAFADEEYHFLMMPVRGLYVALRGRVRKTINGIV